MQTTNKTSKSITQKTRSIYQGGKKKLNQCTNCKHETDYNLRCPICFNVKLVKIGDVKN